MRARTCQFLSLIALAACAGCGNGDGTTVSGKVTQAGAPVSGGSIVFQPVSGTGQAASGMMKADGTYEAKAVQPGEYKVVVETAHLNVSTKKPKLPGDIQAPPTSAEINGLTYVKIDPKYSKVGTTDLKVTVSGSSQTYNVELTPPAK